MIENELILIYFNEAAKKITEGGIKDFIGVSASKMYKDRPKIIDDLNRCVIEGISIFREIEYFYFTTSKTRYLAITYNFIEPDLVLVYTEDITERKKSEQKLKDSEESLKKLNLELEQRIEERTKELKESEKNLKKLNETIESEKIKLEQIMNNTIDGISTLDLHGNVVQSNSAFANLIGYESEKLILGKNMEDFTIKDDVPKIISAMKKGFKEGVIRNLEVVGITKQGDNYNASINAKLIKDENGIFQWLGVIRDITEKKRFEQKLNELNQELEQKVNERTKELKESEEKSRLILENANDMIAVLNDRFEYEYINESVFLKILGYSNDDLIGKNNLPLIHPKDRKKTIITASKILRKGSGFHQVRFKHKNGDYKWLEVTAAIFYNNNGEKKILNIYRDITERKEMEELLKEQVEKLEILNKIISISSSAEDLNVLLGSVLNSTLKLMDFDGGGIYLLSDIQHEAELKYYKGLESDFVDKVKLIKVNESPRDIVFIEGKPIFTENYPKIDPEHSVQWGILSLASIPLFGKDKVIGAINIASKSRYTFSTQERDILQSIGRELGTVIAKLKAEKNLKESEEKFRTIAEQALMGITILQDNIVQYVNQRFADLIGYSVEDIMSWPPGDFGKTIHPDDIEMVMEHVKKRQAGLRDDINQYQYRAVKKNKEVIWFEVFAQPITYRGRSATLGNVIDITEKKKAEEELIRISKLKSEIFTRASHELKTPLIAIKGYTDLLLELHKEEFDGMVLSSLNQIKRGCTIFEKTINDILNTAYLESDRMKLNLSREDLSFLIKYCITDLKGLALARNHEITVDVQDKLVTFFEKERIYEVLSNLIINAIKYTPPGGEIEVKSEVVDNFYRISIKDNGIGFTEEEKEQIFTQFGKIERDGQGWDLVIEGTGLGLYISKKIVEKHDGKIWVESEGRDKGSTFYFTLPIIND